MSATAVAWVGSHPHPVVCYADDIKLMATSTTGIICRVMLVADYLHYLGLTLALDSGKTIILYVGMPHVPWMVKLLG